jgi:hypothetical protein
VEELLDDGDVQHFVAICEVIGWGWGDDDGDDFDDDDDDDDGGGDNDDDDGAAAADDDDQVISSTAGALEGEQLTDLIAVSRDRFTEAYLGYQGQSLQEKYWPWPMFAKRTWICGSVATRLIESLATASVC